MNNKLMINELNKLASPEANRHNKGEINEVLPFASNDVKKLLKGETKAIVGEFTRLVSKQKLENNKDSLLQSYSSENYKDNIINKMLKSVSYEDENHRYDLERVLESLLFNDSKNVQVIHPIIFKYYPLSNNKKNRFEKKIAKFIKDTLAEGHEDSLSNVFNNQEDENLLVSMVLSHLDELEELNENSSYQALLPEVANLFREDFLYISDHRDFFLENFQTLLQHYYFLYTSQIVFKFKEFTQADYSKVNPLYYTLDWEKLNKRRKAFDGIYNFKNLREISDKTFNHIHVQYQLSHNWLNPNFEFITYPELRRLLETKASYDEKRKFLEDLNQWIKDYSSKINLENEAKNISNLEEGIETLYNLLRKGMSEEVCSNVGKVINDSAYGKFLKHRGSLGFTLNITQDFLLLLTALAVKNKRRIPLKKLFEEFEKRGVALDRYSKQEVMTLLDSLNIIEKKSDSGDAQYVKTIL